MEALWQLLQGSLGPCRKPASIGRTSDTECTEPDEHDLEAGRRPLKEAMTRRRSCCRCSKRPPRLPSPMACRWISQRPLIPPTQSWSHIDVLRALRHVGLTAPVGSASVSSPTRSTGFGFCLALTSPPRLDLDLWRGSILACC